LNDLAALLREDGHRRRAGRELDGDVVELEAQLLQPRAGLPTDRRRSNECRVARAHLREAATKRGCRLVDLKRFLLERFGVGERGHRRGPLPGREFALLLRCDFEPGRERAKVRGILLQHPNLLVGAGDVEELQREVLARLRLDRLGVGGDRAEHLRELTIGTLGGRSEAAAAHVGERLVDRRLDADGAALELEQGRLAGLDAAAQAADIGGDIEDERLAAATRHSRSPQLNRLFASIRASTIAQYSCGVDDQNWSADHPKASSATPISRR
jgi:hypothetical protein